MKALEKVNAVSVWTTERQETGKVIPFDALDVELLTIRDQAAVGRIWTDLENRIGHDGLTCSWAWTEIWLKHYGDQVDVWFAIGRLHGEPVAAALLTRNALERIGPFRIRTLQFGPSGPGQAAAGMPANRLLAAPHLRRAFARGLAAGVKTAWAPFDVLRLDGFAPEEIAPFQKTDLDLSYRRRVWYGADLAGLRAAGLTVRKSIHPCAAAKIERAAACLDVRFGPLTVQWAETTPDGLAMLADLRGLHRARWESDGAPSAFASPRFTRFHEDVIEKLLPSGRVAMTRVVAGDRLIGVDYGLIERNRVLALHQGAGLADDRRLSTRALIGALAMQAALDRGLDEYGWLGGDDDSRHDLGVPSRELVWASASYGRRMRALQTLSGVRRQATRD